MRRITFFEEQKVNFEFDEHEGYVAGISSDMHIFPGATCEIVWDGKSYTCIAQDASSYTGVPGSCGLGDLRDFDLPGNGEPFLILSVFFISDDGSEVGSGCILVPTDGSTADSHTVGIYLVGRMTLFEEQTVEDFIPQAGYDGMYGAGAFGFFPITPGFIYDVVWDGKSYPCVAQDVSAWFDVTEEEAPLVSAVAMGNLSRYGLFSNGEPFMITSMVGSEDFMVCAFIAADGSAADFHTVGIYLEEENGTSIFPETELEFTPDATYGYIHERPADFALESGATYILTWDGTVHIVTAYDASVPGLGDFVAVGNGTDFGYEGNNEPFIIGCNDESVLISAFADPSSTHRLAIVQFTEGGADATDPNDVVIKVRSGTDIRYKNVPKVWLTHPSSTDEAPVLVPFTYGEAVSKKIAANFSRGDMAVPIAEGDLVTELTIVKPDTLVPENIAEGVRICGVEGTFVGGGVIEGVHKVTFYSWDGQLLLERYCYQGDDCPCPVAQGRITVEATRPNSTEFVYGDWCGWARAPDVAAQENVLLNVTEDMVLYAAYEITYENIIPEQTLAFTYSSDDGGYVCGSLPGTITLGETYVVVWDGTPHTVTCQEGASASYNGLVITLSTYLGDPTQLKCFFGIAVDWTTPSTGHPFLIQYDPLDSDKLRILTQQTNATHNVWVYK